MVYNLQEAIDILSRTPRVLEALLGGLPDNWVNFHKHDQAFSPSEVVGHLIAGEQTDWIPRMRIMLASGGSKEFPPFEREGFDKNLGLEERLSQFTVLRTQNLEILKESVTADDLSNTGIHPEFGEVTLEQHLATWVVHDLTHIFQIIEALALRYKDVVGPWIRYLRVLNV
ncbi:MAG: DinB family protein [Candidatus Thorarchaeota archaeon]